MLSARLDAGDIKDNEVPLRRERDISQEFSGGEVAEGELNEALDFMKPIHESRRRFLDEAVKE